MILYMLWMMSSFFHAEGGWDLSAVEHDRIRAIPTPVAAFDGDNSDWGRSPHGGLTVSSAYLPSSAFPLAFLPSSIKYH